MAAVRRAHVVWTGDLNDGTGTLEAVTSAAFRGLPVTWASRTETPNGKTSPEELLAGAHASCFSMALSGALAKAATPPQKLEVEASVTFDEDASGFKVSSSALSVKGWVRGVDPAAFQSAAEGAKDGCPISRALAGNVQISVKAELQG